jgi:hypothetical protein
VARYATFKYGAEKYGASSPNNLYLWTFVVDWDGDGVHDYFNEAHERMVDLYVVRGRDSMINPNGVNFAPFPPGEAQVVLDNNDGRYDPWNTSSPIYPNCMPGKFCKIEARYLTTGTQYGVIHGTIHDIQPFNQGKARYVRILIRDGLAWLQKKTINYGLHTTTDVDSNIRAVLTLVGWPPTPFFENMEDSDVVLPYTWGYQRNAYDLIQELTLAERGGVSFHNRTGQFMLYKRTHGGTFWSLGESALGTDMVLSQPWENVYNDIRVNVYPKINDPVNTTLWQLNDVPAIANGAALVFDARFRYSSYSPVCGSSMTFNHTVNAAADGSGANLTATCPLTYDTQIGDGATITITNNSGSAGYITLLRAVGDAIYAPYDTVKKASDATSQSTYGQRTLTIDTPWIDYTVEAQAWANTLLSNLKDPKKSAVVSFETLGALGGSGHFVFDLYDGWQLTLPAIGLGITDFRIGKIEHRWLRPNGQALRTTIKLEPSLTIT